VFPRRLTGAVVQMNFAPPFGSGEIDLSWHSTPQLWVATKKDACGCGECKQPYGMGKTKEQAVADLLEQAVQ
jgi:hypothetical protein